MPASELDHRLLEILVCPVTKGPLLFDRARQELVSKSARLAYPIRDGIPILLESEARPLDVPPEVGHEGGLDGGLDARTGPGPGDSSEHGDHRS